MVLYPNKLPESERVCSGICMKGEKVLAVCAAGACVCMAAVILMPGGAGWYFLLLCFLC